MTCTLLTELGWLLDCGDFRGECQRIRDGDGAAGPALRRLASHALTTSQLQRLASLLDTLEAEGRSVTPLTALRIGLLGTGTLSLVAPLLRGTAVRHGMVASCIVADYGQVEREALDPASDLNRAGCDVILVALDYRGLPLASPASDESDAAARVDASIATLHSICRGLRANSGARLILQTLVTPAETLFGGLDAIWPGSVSAMIDAFNRAIAVECADPSTFLLNTAHLAATVGLANWHNPVQWNLAKFAMSAEMLPLYADHVCRLLSAMQGKARRALILDLDNTLWGGVIGDDGVNGIVIGEGEATGEAFLHIQRWALELRSRGIVLAVCSKNTEEIARAAFTDHPDMLLRIDHIASFKANWNDKASNIEAIAKELSLGLDAFVFLDDNPAERALVRHYLPDVAVPELPDDPAYYVRTLAAAGYFEATAFSQEDRVRADYYKANASRAAMLADSNSIDDFLLSLDMRGTIKPFDAISRSRIQQLIMKSNQFNLTTRRYTEAEIAGLEADPSVFTMQVRLKDRLGDNGMISAIVCRATAPNTWLIDTWLMSCRVLRRGVEKLVLREMLREAREAGITTLLGVYKPSARNALVRDHYDALGFTLVKAGADGETWWSLPTDTVVEAPWFALVDTRQVADLAA